MELKHFKRRQGGLYMCRRLPNMPIGSAQNLQPRWSGSTDDLHDTVIDMYHLVETQND